MTTETELPPRDHNQPAPIETAEQITARMAEQYPGMETDTAALLARARTMPVEVTNETDSATVSALVLEIRSKSKTAEGIRASEKEPYLRAGNAVFAFFSGFMERLDKTETVLHKRVHEYNQRKLAEARRKAAAEQAEADRIAREARQRLADEAQAAAAAAASAERARKAENIAAHTARAEGHADAAEGARVDVMIADQNAVQARLATLQKPADMVRQRFDGGLSTMKQVGYAEIVDKDLLDLNILRPFIKEKYLLEALKAWAKTVDHKKTMAGAIVEMRDSTDIR